MAIFFVFFAKNMQNSAQSLDKRNGINYIWLHILRRDGRVVEGARLESVFTLR